MEGKNKKKKKTKIINENVESNGTYFIQEIHERTENRYSVMNGIKKKNFSMFILTWSEKKKWSDIKEKMKVHFYMKYSTCKTQVTPVNKYIQKSVWKTQTATSFLTIGR